MDNCQPSFTFTLETEDLVLLAAVGHHNQAFQEKPESEVWLQVAFSLSDDGDLIDDSALRIQTRFYELLMIYNKLLRGYKCGEEEVALKVLFEKLELSPFIKRIVEAENDSIVDQAAEKSKNYKTLSFRNGVYEQLTDTALKNAPTNEKSKKTFRARTICGIANSLYLSRIPIRSEKALKMMEKMGYKHGRGLGKDESGQLKPIPIPDPLVTGSL